MSTEATNGEHGVEHQAIDTVVLTYNRATDHLDIGGHAASLDLMLDILARATRVLDLRWRQEEQKKFVAAMQQDARAAELAARLLGKR